MHLLKKLGLAVLGYVALNLSYNIVTATENNAVAEAAKVENYISSVYQQIDFTGTDKVSYTVFSKAMHGYLNLRNAGRLATGKEILSICDFNQPSSANRLWVIDLASHKVLFNTYVAHGQGTGEEFAQKFSNKMNSHQSSLGFYVTTDVYTGEHGTSLHLQGMDQGFNDLAFKRDIVVHGADYVSQEFICENQRLGRSWGCPAVSPQLAEPIINAIKDGTCLFIYYPDQKYLKTAYWINKKVTQLPDYQLYGELTPPQYNRPTLSPAQPANSKM